MIGSGVVVDIRVEVVLGDLVGDRLVVGSVVVVEEVEFNNGPENKLNQI